MNKHLKRFISVICVIAILVSGGYLVGFFYLQHRGQRAVQVATDSLITSDTTAEDEEKLKEEYRKKYPNVDFPDDLLLKYYPTYAKNQDLRGWIYVPEYNINYPVVQSKDNSWYLHKGIDKQYDYWGTPFFDYRNKFNPNDKNLIVFGHNSSIFNDKIFAPLNAYLKIDGFKKAPVIQCDTIYEEMYWKVYAVIITNSKAKDDNGYRFDYMITDFDDDLFSEYIYEINERAIYKTGVDIEPDDKILTISTCNYSFKNARMVIICRKVRENETRDVDVSLAQNNENPRYPQAWYDKRGQKNPYKDAFKWVA